ncbi:T9SS type A sorting domain-containing protein [candidate division KSB1 bacterium]|nr:T9SS type A sorting domain-containing protein [candidate division KSB1 bacterium]
MKLLRTGPILLMIFVAAFAEEEQAAKNDSTANKTATVQSFELAQNYPNPFNPSTTIQFSIPRSADVTIEIFDLLGNRVQQLVQQRYEPGIYSVNVDAKDLPAGVYFYSMTAGDFKSMRRMTLVK